MGTHCFFSESKRPGGVEDVCFEELPKKLYDYYAKTNKVLKMKRIFVEENETETTSETAEGEIEDLEHLRISKTYEEALNQFLKPGEQPPREIVQDAADSDEEEELLPGSEADQISEEHQNDEPSECSENTKQLVHAKIEADAQEELERMMDTDFEAEQFS